MVPAAYAALGVVLVLTTLATLTPRVFGRTLAPVAAITGMIIEWFGPQLITVAFVVSATAAWLGALASPLGLASFVAHAACALALARYLHTMHRSLPVLDGRVVRDEDEPFNPPLGAALSPVSWLPMLTLRIPSMLDVEVERGVLFREVGRVKLRVDIYRPRGASGALPVALYVHGGGWVVGTRRQSRFMMYELAASGFAVFAVSYRLAPFYPLPNAIEDAKAALAWVRAHARQYGADPERITVVGGSAGGHLAAMLALTPNDPRFQPGFEGADTRVSGAVILYGAADLTRVFEEDKHVAWASFLERVVFRRRFRDEPELYRRSQPMTHVHKDAPPILLVHGDLDLLVPIEISRRFAQALRLSGASVVHLLEVPHAHHAFELYPTPVHQRAVRVITRFMAWVDGRPSDPAPVS